MAPLGDECPVQMQWITYDPCQDWLSGQPVRTLRAVQDAADPARGIAAACQSRQDASPEALTTILYTSGTTGEPKGVMLTQGNLASNACATIEGFGIVPDQLRLNFLPLSHIFARTCDLYCWIAEGSRLAIAESRETVIADC